ncbi:MAG TPA: fucose isomerase [Clostridia bacterium]|nr:fucose isomerase [Clostridia bacterium]
MRLKLGIITLLSTLHDAANVENSHYDLISGLKRSFDVYFIDPEEAFSVDLPIVFIGSGGVENYFKNIYDKLPKPVLLLTDSMQNSLSAAMEILTWIRNLGDDSAILHGSLEETVSQIEYSYIACNTKKKLSEAAIGVVGFPSDWLISSEVNYTDAQRKWGVRFKNIEIQELNQQMKEISSDRAKGTADSFAAGAALIKEPNEKDIIEGAKAYLALKALREEYEFDAMTLRCFDLILKCGTTGCLAMSLLNNEDVISGCEGDCQGVFSMLLVNILTGNKAFMANPAYIDFNRNEMVLAHCTIPTCMTDRYIIRNHFESHTGVSVQGIVGEGPVTIFKCGGTGLDKYFVASGQLIENLEDDNMCRTQLKVHLDEDISYFIRNPIANHHLVIKGDHSALINHFMQDMGCKRIM